MKLDKPDGLIALRRTDTGLRLHASHRRSSEYIDTLDLAATGFDGGIVRYSRSGASWPAGTIDAALVLDEVKAPPDAGRPAVRRLLSDAYLTALAVGDPTRSGSSFATMSSAQPSGGGGRSRDPGGSTSSGTAVCPFGTPPAVPTHSRCAVPRCPRSCPHPVHSAFPGVAASARCPRPEFRYASVLSPQLSPTPWRPMT